MLKVLGGLRWDGEQDMRGSHDECTLDERHAV